MALSAKNRAEIVDLIKREVDFERSGISGRIVRDATATPRQGELTDAEYHDLTEAIAFDDVRYVVFSYTTPIAWAHRDHEGVTLVERKFTATTSQHQKMVREAYGEGRVNTRNPQPKGEAPVALSENEEIILRRMRDEYGSEYEMVFKGPAVAVDQQRYAPRDQVETLVLKGLATYCVGIDGHGEWGIQLSDKGRKHLDQIQPIVSRQEQASQYIELTEDELIELADDLGARVYASGTAGEGRRAALEMVAVVRALRARRDATAPARQRVGEYLRQQGIVEAQYEKDIASEYVYAKRNAKPVPEVLDEVRADLYAAKAKLKVSDLRQIVTPVVRDTKAQFDAEQQRRLELWQAKGLPEKQAAFLECIAKGHMTLYTGAGNRSYSGDNTGAWDDESRCKTCYRPDGRTMQAMERKDVIGHIPPIGYSAGGSRSILMLKDPEKTSK